MHHNKKHNVMTGDFMVAIYNEHKHSLIMGAFNVNLLKFKMHAKTTNFLGSIFNLLHCSILSLNAISHVPQYMM